MTAEGQREGAVIQMPPISSVPVTWVLGRQECLSSGSVCTDRLEGVTPIKVTAQIIKPPLSLLPSPQTNVNLHFLTGNLRANSQLQEGWVGPEEEMTLVWVRTLKVNIQGDTWGEWRRGQAEGKQRPGPGTATCFSCGWGPVQLQRFLEW